MSFREKGVWISMLANLAIYGWYFIQLAMALARGEADGAHFFGLLAVSVMLVVLVTVVLTIVLTVIVAVRAPQELRRQEDEREKLIGLKAARLGYVVVASGALAAIGAICLGVDGFLIANELFLALVLSELAKNAAQIYHYRRGV